MKICIKCKKEKEDTEFDFKNKAKGIRSGKCILCTREYGKEHYKKNKKATIARVAKNNKMYLERNREYVFQHLVSNPCIDCGESDILVLAFDHQENKISTITEMINECWSIDKINKEMSKCEVRCFNCHQRRHQLENNTWRAQRIHKDKEKEYGKSSSNW